MDIDIFIPCFVDQLYSQTGLNFVKVLEKAGCTVHYNDKQTCCGQPSFNSGYWKETAAIAKKFLKDFPGDRPIVGPSASCTGFVKNSYSKLFEDKEELAQIEKVSGRVFEFTDFLVNHLKVTDFGTKFPHIVTFHDSCSGLREYGIKKEPRELLSKIEGLTLVEMEDVETCCGFGGTFAVKHSDISQAMVEQKVTNAINTNAEYIVTTESSCLMNMKGYINKNNSPIKVIHIADVLANF